jgi:putative ABC transport system permease protein
VGISTLATRSAIANYGSRKTSPNVYVFGADDNYLALNGFGLLAGRNFSRQDIRSGGNFCLLGFDIAQKLFKAGPEKAVNAVIRINNIPYRVLGILASRGSTLGFNRDNVVVAPFRNVERNFSISGFLQHWVMAQDLGQVQDAMGEAEGVFRAIRKLNTTEESNFVIDRADSIAEKA